MAEIDAHTSSKSRPSVAASARTVNGTRYGALGRPRYGIGVRNGASVSTRSWSSGVSRAASRRYAAFLKVTVPAKLIDKFKDVTPATRQEARHLASVISQNYKSRKRLHMAVNKTEAQAVMDDLRIVGRVA